MKDKRGEDTYDDAEWGGEEVKSCVRDTSGFFGLVLNGLKVLDDPIMRFWVTYSEDPVI